MTKTHYPLTERFSTDCQKPKPKLSLCGPITKDNANSVNQSKLYANTSTWNKTRENVCEPLDGCFWGVRLKRRRPKNVGRKFDFHVRPTRFMGNQRKCLQNRVSLLAGKYLRFIFSRSRYTPENWSVTTDKDIPFQFSYILLVVMGINCGCILARR